MEKLSFYDYIFLLLKYIAFIMIAINIQTYPVKASGSRFFRLKN